MDCTRELIVKGRHWSAETWVANLPTEEAHRYLKTGAPFTFSSQLRIGEAIREMRPNVDVYFIPFP